MKRILLAFALTLISAGLVYYISNRTAETRIQIIQFLAPSLQGNVLGEDSNRSVYVYLPPDYEKTNKRYPVIYYLHGFTGSNEEYYRLKIDRLMDNAIKQGQIPDCILVMPNSNTRYQGSFYTNSNLGGRWADYIAYDVVKLIDSRFRTLADPKYRGISGHSMGGNGALKIAFEHPEIFGSVYALSPSVLDWAADFNLRSEAFERIAKAKDYASIAEDFYATIFVALGRAYSADTSAKPFLCRMPNRFVGGRMQLDTATLDLWNRQLINRQLAAHAGAESLPVAIGFECGLQDEFEHIPVTCKALDILLDKKGIKHEYNEYQGTHYNQVPGMNGRIRQFMIPFFGRQFMTR